MSFVNKVARSRFSMKLLAGVSALSALALGSSHAQAFVPVITSGNSSVTINPSTGVTSWTVNGVQQINVQEFFYRLGASGGQSALGSLPSVVTVNSSSSDTVVYTGATFQATVNYILSAGSSANSPSTLNTNVSISNLSGTVQALHLFDYTDFNLANETSPQAVTITGTPANTAKQNSSTFSASSDTVGQGASGAPSKVQASVGSALFTSISSASSPATLNNTLSASAGDVNFAFEYDTTLAASGSAATFQVGVPSTIQAVPEPASLGLLAIGSLFMCRRNRKA